MSDIEPVQKKAKIESQPRIKGIAPIKPEYIVEKTLIEEDLNDEAEGRPTGSSNQDQGQKSKNKKQRGQNKNRKFDFQTNNIKFCENAKNGQVCPFGDNCRYEHDISKYLELKPKDIEGECPVFKALGYCPSGVKCRWLGSHYLDGKILVDEEKKAATATVNYETNRVDVKVQNDLQRKKYNLKRSEEYNKYLDLTKGKDHEPKEREEKNEKEDKEDKEDSVGKENEFIAQVHANLENENKDAQQEKTQNEDKIDEPTNRDKIKASKADSSAAYIEPPFLPAEKKKVDLRGKHIVSPLTTVGNLPYRRLMKTLGADVTYSEMALALPLIQGQKGEWALTRAHSSESHFGVQIAAAKPWQAVKASQVVAELANEGTKEINLNCGCPIDLLYRQGAGSALLDNPARLLKMVDGMSALSGDIPVTVKIRMGTRDGHPTARRLISRLLDQGQTAAITLHGRSRAQRYTKEADWEYIREMATVVRKYKEDKEDRYENGAGEDLARLVQEPYFIGNGDVYSYEDWYYATEECKVDSCMVARGALIKPWIFEEIESRQYLDKSASQRLDIVKQYCDYGLEHWGSDEYGVNQTRRYLCEFLSFTHRYVPLGILEYLPPKLNDRPPHWRGRNEMETLLASTDYKDWIKITEMYLGKVSESFDFVPKHKSNAY